MRVIAGVARSLPLKTIKSDATRPTTDRIKETLFNMLHPYLYDVEFLDLFSGSGAIGIEALSRGAKHCDFVENGREAFAIIGENLRFTKLQDKGTVHLQDVLTFIRMNEGKKGPYDIVFMDPPYDHLLERDVLTALKDSSLINSETILIFEASVKTDISYVGDLGYKVLKQKLYKTNQHVWLQRIE